MISSPPRPADQVLTVGSGGKKRETGFVRAARCRHSSVGGWTPVREEFKLFWTSWQIKLLWDIFRGGEKKKGYREGQRKGEGKRPRRIDWGCLRRRSGEWLNFMELDLGPHLLHEERQVINEGGTTPMKKLKLLNLSTASHFLSPLTILSDILRLIWITTLSESFLQLKKTLDI